MNLDLNNVVISLFVITILTGGLAIYSWQQRSSGEWAKSFTLLLVSASIWSLAYGLEIGLSDLSAMVFWAEIQYFGIVTAPVAWFVFSRQYTGRAGEESKSSTLWILSLAVVPTITILLVFTNGWHQLIWQSIGINPSAPYSTLLVTYGVWFWVHSLYSYILMLAGTIALLRTYFRFDGTFRAQSAVLLIGAITPWIANVLFLSGRSPLPGIDLSPFGFGLTGVLLTVGIFWMKLFDLIPVARSVAFENMDDGILILDANNRIVDINQAGAEIIGKKIDQIISLPLVATPHIGLKLVKIIDEKNLLPSKIGLVMGGELLYYEVRASEIFVSNGVAGGWLISLRDMSIQEQLRQTREKRTQLLETLNLLSTDITASLDLQDILNTVAISAGQLLEVTSVYISGYDLEMGTAEVLVEYFSPHASEKECESDLGVVYDLEEDFGLASDWIVHDPHNYVTHWDDLNGPRRIIEHMLNYGGKTVLEVPLLVKGELIGTLELWESRSKRIFMDDDLELVHAIAQQAALAMHNAKLYERAVMGSELKSRILTQINHELRTPLSVILAYTELFEVGMFGQLTDEQRSGINVITSSSNYLHSLVKQLLIQSEFENGKVKLQNTSFSVTEVVEETFTQLSVLTKEKGIFFTSHINPQFPKLLFGDQQRIQQILFNLVDNAIKYTDDKGEVDFSIFQPDADHWAIKVCDTGRGIPLEDQASIFEPFWQTAGVDMNISKNGAGLGLSIVSELVTLMNGKISVESEVNKGSIFLVVFPLHVIVENVI